MKRATSNMALEESKYMQTNESETFADVFWLAWLNRRWLKSVQPVFKVATTTNGSSTGTGWSGSYSQPNISGYSVNAPWHMVCLFPPSWTAKQAPTRERIPWIYKSAVEISLGKAKDWDVSLCTVPLRLHRLLLPPPTHPPTQISIHFLTTSLVLLSLSINT